MKPLSCALIWVAFMSGIAGGAKLLVITSSTYSHCAEVSTVGQALADRGHNVSILISGNFKHKNCYSKQATNTSKLTPIFTTPSKDTMSVETLTKEISRGLMEGEDFSMFKRFNTMQLMVRTVCADLLSDTKTINALQYEQFDLMIVDSSFLSYCFLVIPYITKTPHVSMSTIYEDFVIGRPFMPSIVPGFSTKYTDEMTFFQRLGNFITPLALHAVMRYVLLPIDLVQTLSPELTVSNLVNLASMSEFYLYNYNPILSYPQPVMPNTAMIGGIATSPGKPLSGDLKHYFEKSTRGVVLVTFGGNTLDLPTKTKNGLMAAFQRLNYDVVWKFLEDKDVGNVKQLKWLPQNDILAHHKTVLFVSHCGNNGVFEALYHGVPLVCTPIIGDQFFNGVRVEHWEVGKLIPLLSSSENSIYEAINEVINNPKYKNNMKKVSAMYHSQPETPREKAVFWVEFVMKYGGSHLRSRVSEMSLFSYMGYDIVCFLFVVIHILAYIFYKVTVALLRCCCKNKSTAPPKQNIQSSKQKRH